MPNRAILESEVVKLLEGWIFIKRDFEVIKEQIAFLPTAPTDRDAVIEEIRNMINDMDANWIYSSHFKSKCLEALDKLKDSPHAR